MKNVSVWVGDVTTAKDANVVAAAVFYGLVCRQDQTDDLEMAIPHVQVGDTLDSQLIANLVETRVCPVWLRSFMKEVGQADLSNLDAKAVLPWLRAAVEDDLSRITVTVTKRSWVGIGELEIEVRVT
tara:strand:- start:4888 stop:5268 length:381 start_codon:yes stop_codon:yes gene_type:complete